MDLNSVASGISGAGIGNYISIGILIFAGISVFFGVIFGFKRGFSKSVVRIITMALAAAGAFLVAANITSAIAGVIGDKGLVGLLKDLESYTGSIISEQMYEVIGSFDVKTAVIVISIILAVIIAPVTFILLFYLFKLVSLLIFFLISAMLGLSGRHKGFVSRFCGMIVAVAQSAIIIGVVLLPLAGFAALADEITDNLIKETDNEDTKTALTEIREEILDDVLENPIISVIIDAGGKDLFKTLTSIEYDGDKYCAYDEFVVLSGIAGEVGTIEDWNNPTEEDNRVLERVTAKISDNSFTSTVISGVMRGFSDAVVNGPVSVTDDPTLGTFVNSVFTVFSTSTEENLEGDLTTVTHVYYILGKYGVIDSFSDDVKLRQALLEKHGAEGEEKTVIDYVVDELYLNERTAPIVDSLTEISIKVMCAQMGMENAGEIYESVKGDVKDVLVLNADDFDSEDEYLDHVKGDLDAALKLNGITVDDKTLDNMSQYIADNYGDTSEDELTDEDINRAILSYYNAYAEANPDFKLEDYNPEGIN